MLFQGAAIIAMALVNAPAMYIVLCVLLGFGTALVYPTFLVVVANNSAPQQRAESIGIFRLWRDSGYAFGAILSGILADQFGLLNAILSIGILTILSALVVQFRMTND